MVAVIEYPDLQKAFYYNENKVTSGQASIIYAHLFSKEAEKLSEREKIQRFRKLNALNNRISSNMLHIFLSFHPSEVIEKERLIEIARDYMTEIGFGKQPFLVYEHFDTANQHIHILTTIIQRNGKEIDIAFIGRDKSSPARKKLEVKYGLIPAIGRGKDSSKIPELLDPGIIPYGKTPTKTAISNAVRTVVEQYKFANFAEFNAALSQFGVVADKGEEDSIVYKRGGLLYSIIGLDGAKKRTPIKASSIFGKPTLSNLEELFLLKKKEKAPFRARLCEVIDDALKISVRRKDFLVALEGNNVKVLFRQNKEGLIYGITFVDHISKCVFNGSDLSKNYSAQNVLGQLTTEENNPWLVTNRILCTSSLATINLADGLSAVLSGWRSAGIVVEIKGNNNNNRWSTYVIGHAGSPDKFLWPVGQEWSRYFRINSLTPQHLRQIFLPERASRTQQFLITHFEPTKSTRPGTSPLVFWSGKLSDELLQPYQEENDFISNELLREAKKKKKRKRQ